MDIMCSQLVNLNILYTIEVLDMKTHFHIRSGCLRKLSYVTEVIWGVAVHDVRWPWPVASGIYLLLLPLCSSTASFHQWTLFVQTFCIGFVFRTSSNNSTFGGKLQSVEDTSPWQENVGAQSTTSGINHAKTKRQVWNLVRRDLWVSESCRWVACKASNAFVTQQMPCRQVGGDCSTVIPPPGSTHPGHALLHIMQITQVQAHLGDCRRHDAPPQENIKKVHDICLQAMGTESNLKAKTMDMANPTRHGRFHALRNVYGQLKWAMPMVNGNWQWQWASLTRHGRHWCVGSGQCQGLLMRRYLSGHLHAGTHNDKLEFSPLNTLIVTHWTKEMLEESAWSCI